MLTFAVPMAPVSRCDYWDHAMKNLKVTLNSMLKQTDDSYNIVVAYTEGDELPGFCKSVKITTVAVPDAGEWSADKDDKTIAMLNIHGELGNKYFLRTDWDDIYHKDLVAYVVDNENDHGFIIDKGFFYRPADNTILGLDNFFMQCGSCHLVNYSKDEIKNGVHHPKKFTFHHQHIHQYRAALGKPLMPMALRAGMYTITGKNISTPKHERIFKNVEWHPMIPEVAEAFGLEV